MSWNLSQQSLVFAFCLLLLDPPWIFFSSRYRCGLSILAAPHVLTSPASRGGFYCDQEGGTLGSPLGDPVQSSGKIMGPTPIPPILVCPSLFPVMYSF